MQTTGTVLLAVKQRSLAWVRSAAQDGHSACGLLYLAAVSADWREQEHRQETVDTDPSLVRDCQSVSYRRSRHWQSVLRHPRYRYPAIIKTMITATATAEDIKITARMCSRTQSWRAFRCRSFNEVSGLGG
jgi:hypothetical protein